MEVWLYSVIGMEALFKIRLKLLWKLLVEVTVRELEGEAKHGCANDVVHAFRIYFGLAGVKGAMALSADEWPMVTRWVMATPPATLQKETMSHFRQTYQKQCGGFTPKGATGALVKADDGHAMHLLHSTNNVQCPNTGRGN